MAVYNRKLYLIIHDGEIHVYDPNLTDNHESPPYAQHKGTVSISFSYGTRAIQDMYRTESEKCIWKDAICPPGVFHYEVQDRFQRQSVQMSVKDGRLHNLQGELIDTSDADEIHLQKAAIFVMGPDGQILLSKYHRSGLLHMSSLLAGILVSGAGLMVVHRGKIGRIYACSIHYRPDEELNNQVIESLFLKGYKFTDYTVDYYYDCNYSEQARRYRKFKGEDGQCEYLP